MKTDNEKAKPTQGALKAITEDQVERIGLLRDKADNHLCASILPLPPQFHVEGLKSGMEEIKTELESLYKELTK